MLSILHLHNHDSVTVGHRAVYRCKWSASWFVHKMLSYKWLQMALPSKYRQSENYWRFCTCTNVHDGIRKSGISLIKEASLYMWFYHSFYEWFYSRVVTWMQPYALEAVKRKKQKLQMGLCELLLPLQIRLMWNFSSSRLFHENTGLEQELWHYDSLKLWWELLQWPRSLESKLYDTIRDAIISCARKPIWVSLIYRTEWA